MGQVVFTQTLSNLQAGKQTVSLNTENWATGIYNVNISTSNGNVSRKLEVIK
jgi:lipopolysaccharide export system protein LptA